MSTVTKTVEIDGKTITFETGYLAKQASGSVVIRSGDSMVLCTTVVAAATRPIDFLPLNVDYQDRNGANGTIPGSYFKREGRSSERETLASRLIDRPLRPLFPKHFRSELQAIATCMSYDKDHETDVLALCGVAASFHISDAPLSEAAAGVRIVRVGGEWVINPAFEQSRAADVSLVVAGTRDAITMVEGGASEASEADMLDAFDRAHDAIRKIIDVIDALRSEVGKDKMEVPPAPELDADVVTAIAERGESALRQAMATPGKHARKYAMRAARSGVIDAFVEESASEDPDALKIEAKKAWQKLIKKVMRGDVITDGKRLDGRAVDEIRDINCDVGISPRAHGSAVFTRGETQAYVTLALGTEEDLQRIEVPYNRREERWFMLTYYFPPFCVGEVRPLRGPKRREVGHGVLARRAVVPLIPAKEDFPYTMRSTAEILESNGSSSMATVCGTCLAMMDAGVPIKAPVAGIAMGLIKEGDDFAVLSDILGDEDFLGDMDFKVCGTEQGITAFQLDCKISGISREIMAKAMEQARVGRLHILSKMVDAIAKPRADLSPYAPRITTLHIKQDKIRDLIGPGGKVIRGIQDTCEVRIKVDDSGRVDVASSDGDSTERAIAMIREITQEAELGALYVGVVKRVVDFGAFVEIFPGTDGLIHISHLAQERVDKVTDVVNEGDEVLVRVIDIDRAGKIRLSRKEALEAR